MQKRIYKKKIFLDEKLYFVELKQRILHFYTK